MNQQYHTPIEDLLVKHLLNEANPDEVRFIEDWLSANPANGRYYQELKLIWEKSLPLSPGRIDEANDEEEEAWQTFRRKIRIAEHASDSRSRPIGLPALKWIAAATLLTAIGIALLWNNRTSDAWPAIVSTNAVRTDTLPDGSIITLNKNSSLSPSAYFRKGDRDMDLKGEAFFRIAPNKDRPFRVKTDGVIVTVLGTAFNMRTASGKTEIRVESGRIRVNNHRGNIIVRAAESISLGDDDATLQTHPTAHALHEYYHPRDFNCNDTPLWQLVDALNEAYDAHIIIGDPSLRTRSINTIFQNEPLDRILSILGETLRLKIERTSSGIILK